MPTSAVVRTNELKTEIPITNASTSGFIVLTCISSIGRNQIGNARLFFGECLKVTYHRPHYLSQCLGRGIPNCCPNPAKIRNATLHVLKACPVHFLVGDVHD